MGGGKEDRRLVRRRLYKFTEEEELRLRARVAQGVKFFLFQEVNVECWNISIFVFHFFFFFSIVCILIALLATCNYAFNRLFDYFYSKRFENIPPSRESVYIHFSQLSMITRGSSSGRKWHFV